MIKFKILPSVIGLILIAFSALKSQDVMRIKHACNFAAAEKEGDLYTYDASKEAVAIIDKIMKVNVLPQNFIIKSADCSNALATTEGKQRYILYSTTFLENFKKDAQTQWAAYSVLAHEIGHHLSNHDLEEATPSVRKRFELEADRFSGGVLFKLGASLEQAQSGINSFSLNGESNTHPSKRSRLEALSVGWKQAEELSENKDVAEVDDTNKTDSDEANLFKKALEEKDAEKAIDILDNVIELNGNFIDAYLERGKRQKDKTDIRRNYNYAIEDFTTYINVRSKNPIAYFERGFAYFKINNNVNAIADFNTAIKLNTKYAEAYYFRAWAKYDNDQLDGAIADLNTAIKIKSDYADAYYLLGNFRYGQAEYALAIEQFDKALKADLMHYHALNLRAAAKQILKKYDAAIADFDLLELRHPKDFDSFYNRAECYQAINKHKEAISDWDKVLKINAESSDAYMLRGVSKFVLDKKNEAEMDFNKAVESTILKDTQQGKIGCALVKYGFYKEALAWLNLALESNSHMKLAQDCKNEALSKIKN